MTVYEFTYYGDDDRTRRSGMINCWATPEQVETIVTELEFPNHPQYAMCEVTWVSGGVEQLMVLVNDRAGRRSA